MIHLVTLRSVRVPVKFHIPHNFVLLQTTCFPVEIVTKTAKVALETKLFIEHFATRDREVKDEYCVVEGQGMIDFRFNFYISLFVLLRVVNFGCLESPELRNLFFDEGWNERNLSELSTEIPTIAIVPTGKYYIWPY